MEYIVKILFKFIKKTIVANGIFLPNKFFSLLFFGEPDFSEIQELYPTQNNPH